MSKCNIPPFLGNRRNGVKLVTLALGDYAFDLRSKSVEEYHKEIEMNLLRAHIGEREDATMARFLHGLNREI
ncbi:hypothetical protein CR513_56883, partial [Mucuna pruriens]